MSNSPVIRVVHTRDDVTRCMCHVCDVYVSCPPSSRVNCLSRPDCLSCYRPCTFVRTVFCTPARKWPVIVRLEEKQFAPPLCVSIVFGVSLT